MARGLKPPFLLVVDVHAKARTYLRSNGKNNSKSKDFTGWKALIGFCGLGASGFFDSAALCSE
jgi:hypothetical protein